MELSIAAQWIAFGVFALVAVAGGLGMATTMSMFRSGIFLMASFIGVAGLFILLSADLLGMLQVMMYIGGMLVMILFMVLFSSDPGGAMMASHMKLPLVERLFSRGLAHQAKGEEDGGGGGEQHGGHEQHGGEQHGDGQHGGEQHGDGQHGGGHGDMSMFTPVKKPAAALALATGGVLLALLVAVPAWPTVRAVPEPDSARRIGALLMNDYMIAFEGAGLLILLGIFAAVFVQRPGAHPDAGARDVLQAAVDEAPAPIAPDEAGDEAASTPEREGDGA